MGCCADSIKILKASFVVTVIGFICSFTVPQCTMIIALILIADWILVATGAVMEIKKLCCGGDGGACALLAVFILDFPLFFIGTLCDSFGCDQDADGSNKFYNATLKEQQIAEMEAYGTGWLVGFCGEYTTPILFAIALVLEGVGYFCDKKDE